MEFFSFCIFIHRRSYIMYTIFFMANDLHTIHTQLTYTYVQYNNVQSSAISCDKIVCWSKLQRIGWHHFRRMRLLTLGTIHHRVKPDLEFIRQRQQKKHNPKRNIYDYLFYFYFTITLAGIFFIHANQSYFSFTYKSDLHRNV